MVKKAHADFINAIGNKDTSTAEGILKPLKEINTDGWDEAGIRILTATRGLMVLALSLKN
jgi:hypothetical protein